MCSFLLYFVTRPISLHCHKYYACDLYSELICEAYISRIVKYTHGNFILSDSTDKIEHDFLLKHTRAVIFKSIILSCFVCLFERVTQ
jgi:hypothetical protein